MNRCVNPFAYPITSGPGEIIAKKNTDRLVFYVLDFIGKNKLNSIEDL
ncbi:MAG: hypothetical protein GY699_20400 [Desulfobacteraceae bacterium]|nr:hypothetical protein [Desulfobacteraceae bacterium]